jgi:hypothetical protein
MERSLREQPVLYHVFFYKPETHPLRNEAQLNLRCASFPARLWKDELSRVEMNVPCGNALDSCGWPPRRP